MLRYKDGSRLPLAMRRQEPGAQLPSNEAVRFAVEFGDCATAISDLVVVHSLAAGTLHRVNIELPKRSFFALRHKERYASRAEKALFASFGV